MELNKKGLKERQQWLDKGYHLSDYDREEVAASTRKTAVDPFWGR